MHDTGCLELVHWDDPEGGYGEGGGRSQPSPRVGPGKPNLPLGLRTKVRLVKAMVFPVVMYGCENCTPTHPVYPTGVI